MQSTRLPLLSILLATAMSIGACRSVYPRSIAPDSPLVEQQTALAVPSAASSPALEDANAPTSIWPSRWGTDSVTPEHPGGVIVPLDHSPSEFIAAHLSRFHQLRTGDVEYADMQALATEMHIETPYKFQAEGPGCYLFVRQAPLESDATTPDPSSDEPELAFKFVSAQRSGFILSGNTMTPQVEMERTWFTYRTQREGKDFVGTVLLMPGMFGTPEPVIDGMEKYLRSKGWSVLRMLSHPSRFTQRQQFAVPKGSEPEVAQTIAEMFDTRTAEAAYSASAALRYVHEQYPERATKPVVLLGMSGGAMILPSVYAFDPDLYDAGVLIAGGGNFLEINIRSNYAKWIDAIDLDADPSDAEIQPLADAQLRELVDLYILNSKLDSLHTATTIHDLPLLMLHGTSDKAVPSSTGDALYEALAKPERWVYPVGHELIFAALPMQTPKIERWMREHALADTLDDSSERD